MLKALKRWWKFRRVFNRVKHEMGFAVFCHHWGRAENLCDRMDRLASRPPQHRLRNYQQFKAGFVKDLGYPARWQFDPYTLS